MWMLLPECGRSLPLLEVFLEVLFYNLLCLFCCLLNVQNDTESLPKKKNLLELDLESLCFTYHLLRKILSSMMQHFSAMHLQPVTK
jgi:hypothetical protein